MIEYASRALCRAAGRVKAGWGQATVCRGGHTAHSGWKPGREQPESEGRTVLSTRRQSAVPGTAELCGLHWKGCQDSQLGVGVAAGSGWSHHGSPLPSCSVPAVGWGYPRGSATYGALAGATVWVWHPVEASQRGESRAESSQGITAVSKTNWDKKLICGWKCPRQRQLRPYIAWQTHLQT